VDSNPPFSASPNGLRSLVGPISRSWLGSFHSVVADCRSSLVLSCHGGMASHGQRVSAWDAGIMCGLD